MDEKQFKEIVNKLDLIIRLLAQNIVKDMESQKEKILMLSSFGFGATEIAKILGKKSATEIAPYLYPKERKIQRGKVA